MAGKYAGFVFCLNSKGYEGELTTMIRRYWIIGVITVALVAVGAVYLYMENQRVTVRLSERGNETPPVEDIKKPVKSMANLYFANKDNTNLIAESRVLLHAGDPVTMGKSIIKELSEGPQGELMPTLPTGTTLRSLFILEDGTAYLDMSEAISDRHPGGCDTELLTLFSVVNSMILNIENITAVKILIGGQEATTLAGHMDIRYPYKANMLLVR